MLLAPVKLKDNVHFRGALKHYKCEIKWLKLVQESSSSNILFLGKSTFLIFELADNRSRHPHRPRIKPH